MAKLAMSLFLSYKILITDVSSVAGAVSVATGILIPFFTLLLTPLLVDFVFFFDFEDLETDFE
ncbi:unnamed protein product, partial [marine sediment metagenome]